MGSFPQKYIPVHHHEKFRDQQPGIWFQTGSNVVSTIQQGRMRQATNCFISDS